MKMAFVIEYFFPFDKGGSQWSTYYLARDLVEKGHEVTIITPNYGSQSSEIIDGVKIIRVPLYKKVKTFDSPPGNFFFTNPLFIIWSAIFYFINLKKEKPDLIHVHGKYSIPGARIANIFLRKPIMATIRDYVVICNYGICLLNRDKSCSLANYYKEDFKTYLKNYSKAKNPFSYFSNFIFSVWGRGSTKFLKYCSLGIAIIVLSKAQKKIFTVNGFKNLEVIYNSYDFGSKPKLTKKENLIVYAGRLTPGKGVSLIIDALPDLIKAFPNYQFYFAGEGFLKNKLTELSLNDQHIRVIGNLSHEGLLKLFAKAKVVLAPSIWPEPFGRVVLEALVVGTPVIVGKRAGLAEEVDNRWGTVTGPNISDLIKAVKKIIEGNDIYTKRLKEDYTKIAHKFGEEVTAKYLRVYEELTK